MTTLDKTRLRQDRLQKLARREWQFQLMDGAVRNDLRQRLSARDFRKIERQLDSLGRFVTATFEHARRQRRPWGTAVKRSDRTG